MNSNNLLDAIGEIKDQYILSAVESRKGRPVKRHSFKKPLLVAALVAMILMLAGCGIAYAQGWFATFFAQRNKTPLTKAEVEYIDKLEQSINETMTRTEETADEVVSQDGYTLRVKSVMTDGYMAYITIGITGPKDTVLNKTVIPGYSTLPPSICAGNFMQPGFFESAQEGVQFGYTSMGAVEDNDGLDYTQDLILTLEAESENDAHPFAPDKVWKLHIEDLVATYHDLEAQKALDEQHGGGEYISSTEDGVNPYPEVILAKGSWDFEISFADKGARTVELIGTPVTANICISGKFDDDPDVFKDVEITSFVLSSLSATVVVDTDGFLELQDYNNGKYVYAVMKDGTQVELRSSSADGPGKVKLVAVRPIDLDNVSYVLLADGTKLPTP